MRARDDDGVELNAEYSVAADEPYLSVFLESAGGPQRGSDRPRNDQYAPVLALLLSRLRDRGAVLVAALVASRQTASLPERERALLPGPRDLATVRDIEQLRLDITSAQGRVGQPPGAPKAGNNSKRLQLRVDVPGYGPAEAARLERDLAAGRRLPEAGELLRGLIGKEIKTVGMNKPNMVLAVRGGTALVRTQTSPDGQPVQVSEVQSGLDKLASHGSVLVSVAELGYRSAFIGAVLATLPDAVVTRNPAAVALGYAASEKEVSEAMSGEAWSKVRRERTLRARQARRAGGRAPAP